MLPLKTDAEGNLLPIQNDRIRKVPPLDDIVLFFKYAFAPAERKFKVMLLTQLGARLRISETCAINLDDFLPNTNFRKFRVRIQKKKNNYITEKEIPEAIAAILRSWIADNKNWIYSRAGYIFPHTNNNYIHTPARSLQNWFCKKRKQLVKLFPKRSFGWTIGQTRYKTLNSSIKKNYTENRYMWSTHVMKRIAGTLIYKIGKDPELTRILLSHDDAKVTKKYYIDQALLLEEGEAIMMNKCFDQKFYDSIKGENEQAVAVWHELDAHGKTGS